MTDNFPNQWRNFIGGEWADGPETLMVDNPATGEPLAEMACADVADVDRAVAAARACVDGGALAKMLPVERANMLLRMATATRELAEEGAHVACLENGKRLSDAREEFEETARYFEYYAGMADKIEGTSIPLGNGYADYTVYEPFGVSAQVVPWNFPVSICARSLAPALAAGNAVVVKSPEVSPLALSLLGRVCVRASVPEGAASILCGLGREAGAALVSHRDIDQIVFTGSVPTGRSILHAAADRALPSVMELGGKSAAVVYEDADLDQVLNSVRNGIFFNSGQVCSAMSRILIHESIYDALVGRIVELAQGLTLGSGLDDPDLTPLVSRDQLNRVEAICRKATEEGARALTGGERQGGTRGYFMQPTVFTEVTPGMGIFREEVFGPVIVAMPFSTEDEAISLANGTEFGLVAGVFTRDLNRALRATQKLVAGQVFVNEWFAGGIETPFGGTKSSGFGREKGQEALYNYVRTKNVAIRVEP